MKIKVIQVNKSWNITNDLDAITKWLKIWVDVEFTVEKLEEHVPTGKSGIPYYKWRKLQYDKNYDIVVLLFHKDELEMYRDGRRIYGLASAIRRLDGKNQPQVVMMSGEGIEDPYDRWVNMNSRTAGTLRHELVHCFYMMSGQKDMTHFYDYKKEHLETALHMIVWRKVIGILKAWRKLRKRRSYS